MSRKLYTTLLPLFAVAAFAMTATAAQAQPHWYSNGVRIASAKKVKVLTHGELDFTALGVTITCKATDDGFVENPAPGGAAGPAGIDSIESFANKECTPSVPPCEGTETVELTPGKLPWATKLLAGPPIRDEITGIELKLECNKAGVKRVLDTFTGTLTPKIVNGAPVGTCKEATDSFAEFDEPGSGFLVDPLGNKAFPSGKDFIEGPAGDRCITVKNP
jgi:hypothetical protein